MQLAAKLKAYTLIELLIVIAIIGLLALLAIPTYQYFGAKQQFYQKSNEVRLLATEAYNSARNPEPDVEYYVFTPYDKAEDNADAFVLSRLKKGATEFETIKTVPLLKNESLSCETDGGDQCGVLYCKTDATLEKPCTLHHPGTDGYGGPGFSAGSSFTLHIDDFNVSKYFTFLNVLDIQKKDFSLIYCNISDNVCE